MLKPKVLEKLNEQIGRELYSSHLYLQMSGWCAAQGLDGCAAFLRTHSQEEMSHMLRLFDYVQQSDAQPLIPALDQPPHEFESVKDLFRQVHEHEKSITGWINELVQTTFEAQDYFTFNFLQWYVAEQHEEEALARTILDRLELIGLEGRGLYFFDADLGRLARGEKPESLFSGGGDQNA